jgi:hypothetical protein
LTAGWKGHEEWPKCWLCGLSAPDLVSYVGSPLRCPDIDRCRAVRDTRALGGPVWPGKPPDARPSPPAPRRADISLNGKEPTQ